MTLLMNDTDMQTLIFTPAYGHSKTVFTFLFETETYRIIGENELAKSIIEKLDANN